MTAAFAIPGPRAPISSWAGWLSTHAPVSPSRRFRTRPVTTGAGSLPPARSVLAITSRPGKESAELGGLLHAFRTTGARVALLCLTRGEASKLNATSQRPEVLRPRELQLAAGVLGVSSIAVADYPDGELGRCPTIELTERVQRAMTEYAPDLILVVDPAEGDADDAEVARAAILAAESADVPVVARTGRGASGGWRVPLRSGAAGARAVQRSAVAAHASQADALPEVRRRLDRLGDEEQLRWLRAPESDPDARLLVPHRRVPVAS
jgi:LmbE family N-acetylglucosaminyl deacetylase